MTPAGPPWGVVHCVFSVAIGGQEMVILSLASRADRSRFAPRVLCLHSAGELAPRFEAAGVPVDVLTAPIGAGSMQALSAVRRYLHQHRPAILHTHNPSPHQYGALARPGSGVPVLVHTKHGRNQTLTGRGLLLERLAGRMTDAVVGVSRDAAEVAHDIERIPWERIRIIHNGIDPGPIATAHPGTGWRAVHVARLNHVKDQATLLRAARLVLDANPAFRLDIVGDGELRGKLEQLAADLALGDAVTFHGFRRDVRPFLDAADVFVLSSTSEGIAITLLEAMAAGLPVVATDVGGNREVIEAGATGLLVPARSPVALSNAIIDVLADPGRAATMGAGGSERVRRSFSLDAMLRAYDDLYLELLRQRTGSRAA
jgi:glycosyltransferase involved in cell wall biosynthesis